MDNDPRIGYTDETGARWPEMDLSGQPYTRPAGITWGLGDGRFVVVNPYAPRAAQREAFEALKAQSGSVSLKESKRRGGMSGEPEVAG